MIREEKFNLLNEILRYEENNDIGNLTRAERREFQQWISEALEQQPKIGRWIHNKCDKCGASRPPLFDNYCPNCGAKMQEVEE